MKFKRFLAVMLVLAMTASMLTACGKKEEGAGTDTQASDDRSAYPGTADANSITVNITSEPPEMNSITTTDTTSFTVIRHVIENLVELDANDNVIPGVAKTWDISEDGLTYTFHLRDDMKWSNGEKVTAKDFVFAWRSLLTPSFAADYSYFGFIFKNGLAFNNGEVGEDQLGFKAVDDYTLEVTLENPTAYFLSQLAFGVLAPMNETAYEEFGDAYGTDADKMAYNGPFVMSSWEHESKIVLTKNPDFYDADKIKLETINMVMINDSNAALNSFKAGEVDIIGVNGDQSKLLKGEGFPVYSYDDGATAYLEYNLNDPALSNVNLRTAITYAVDKQGFVDAIMKNGSKPATSFTSPALNGLEKKFSEEVGTLQPVYDVEKAKEYLEKAKQELGVDTFELTLIGDDSDTAIKSTAFVQEQLKTNLGLDVKVEPMPFKSRLERMSNKDFQIVFALWGPDYNDPMTFLDMYETNGGNNHGSYTDATYDDLLNKVRTTLDAKERMGYLTDLEKKVMTDLPIGPIYWRSRDYVLSGKIKSGAIRTAFQDMNYRFVELNK